MEQSPIDKYDKKSEIGSGGRGRVYLVQRNHYQNTQQPQVIQYAMKVIKYQSHQNQTVLRQFQILKALNHPHIVKAYQFYDDKIAQYYLVMQYCNEGHIEKLILNERRFKQKLGIAAMIASGVKYLHEQKVIHRDLKPYNILVKNGIIKIVDFGIAKAIIEQKALIEQNFYYSQSILTPFYVAPEIYEQEEYNQKVDIWALGIIFLELFSNTRIRKLIEGPDNRLGPKPPCIRQDFPKKQHLDQIEDQKIREMVSKMLQKKQKQRLSIYEVWQILKDYYPKYFYQEQHSNKGQRHICPQPDGNFYQGQMKGGKKEGKGNYYFKNGNHFVGEFKQGLYHGRGILFIKDASYYECQFKNGLYNDKGAFYSHKGKRQEVFFTPFLFLISQRIERQKTEQLWDTKNIRSDQAEELKNQIQRLICKDLSSKMLSLEYRSINQSSIQIQKICGDKEQENYICKIYDIVIKWIFLKLWGGNQSINTVIQILPTLMSALERKKLVLSNYDVQLIIGVIRQYLIVNFQKQQKIDGTLVNIVKHLICLSSGEIVIDKIFKQLRIDLSSIHKHLNEHAIRQSKRGLVILIKIQITDLIKSQNNLDDASKIEYLKSEPQFNQMLFKIFSQQTLSSYGFKKLNKCQQKQKQNNLQNDIDTLDNSTSYMNNSQSIQIQKIQIQKHKKPAINNKNVKPNFNGQDKFFFNKQFKFCAKKQNKIGFDLSIYQFPNSSTPLAKNLIKLLPPNQETLLFFVKLFENCESNELLTYAKIIFGSILKSVIQLFSNRNDYQPTEIINQVMLLQRAIKCKNIINNIEELLSHVINFAISQLIKEDQDKVQIAENLIKRGIQFEVQKLIKAINGVMLRILENGCLQDVVNTLFAALIHQQKLNNKQYRTKYLIIKCILRINDSFCQNIKPNHIVQYFANISEYLDEISIPIILQEFKPQSTEKMSPQDSLINSIVITIAQIYKGHKVQIWKYYEKAMLEVEWPDLCIYSYLNFLETVEPTEQNKNVIKPLIKTPKRQKPLNQSIIMDKLKTQFPQVNSPLMKNQQNQTISKKLKELREKIAQKVQERQKKQSKR